jgi:hypothetical protein
VTEDHDEHQPDRDDGGEPEEEGEYRIHALIYCAASAGVSEVRR